MKFEKFIAQTLEMVRSIGVSNAGKVIDATTSSLDTLARKSGSRVSVIKQAQALGASTKEAENVAKVLRNVKITKSIERVWSTESNAKLRKTTELLVGKNRKYVHLNSELKVDIDEFLATEKYMVSDEYLQTRVKERLESDEADRILGLEDRALAYKDIVAQTMSQLAREQLTDVLGDEGFNELVGDTNLSEFYKGMVPHRYR